MPAVYTSKTSLIYIIIRSIIYTYLWKIRALTKSSQANSSLCNLSYERSHSFILWASHDAVAQEASINEELKNNIVSQAIYASLIHQTLKANLKLYRLSGETN